jgi:hypothetical protein
MIKEEDNREREEDPPSSIHCFVRGSTSQGSRDREQEVYSATYGLGFTVDIMAVAGCSRL